MGLALFLLALGAGLAFAGARAVQRSRRDSGVGGRASSPAGSSTATVGAPTASVPPEGNPGSRAANCPVCLSEYRGQVRFCPIDGAELKGVGGHTLFVPGMICPTCRRGYPVDAAFCPEDLDELVPYGLYGASTRTQLPQRLAAGKICPECGDRYVTGQVFCGRDGALLVVVN